MLAKSHVPGSGDKTKTNKPAELSIVAPCPDAAATPVIETVDNLKTTDPVELSIVMPCLNEAETLEICIQKAQRSLSEAGIRGEIIIADNGSTDGSQEIATRNGARVVHASRRGYGAALQTGFLAAKGKFIIMADSDDSYDLSNVMPFVTQLRHGHPFVMGTRIKGEIAEGAMPWLHRYIGNPILTGLGNLFFGTHLSDYHCGIRGFTRQLVLDLNLSTPGMEFATEMVAKAAIQKVAMVEIPVVYRPDGRTRPPHLRTWRDGWRHLRFMAMLSPTWTFLYPGLLVGLAGVVIMLALLFGLFDLGKNGFDIPILLLGGFLIIVGFQLLSFWLGARLVIANIGMSPLPKMLTRYIEKAPITTGVVVCTTLMLLGAIPSLHALQLLTGVNLGVFNPSVMLRWLVPGLVLIVLGIHALFSSFVFSLLGLSHEGKAKRPVTGE